MGMYNVQLDPDDKRSTMIALQEAYLDFYSKSLQSSNKGGVVFSKRLHEEQKEHNEIFQKVIKEGKLDLAMNPIRFKETIDMTCSYKKFDCDKKDEADKFFDKIVDPGSDNDSKKEDDLDDDEDSKLKSNILSKMHTKHPKELIDDDDDTKNYVKLDDDNNTKKEPKVNNDESGKLDLGDGPKLKK